jgi:hypothetical protein
MVSIRSRTIQPYTMKILFFWRKISFYSILTKNRLKPLDFTNHRGFKYVGIKILTDADIIISAFLIFEDKIP